ncbi:efflux RND transporter periplasmic adaptor subunit [Sandaracinus amylolyticus]|uniref:efflux RND transporter periplasmic adaptor subunit n=1 Tax=Sandaracinus amylolyticus TaxID=927083 RepID=UPI001F40C157|nr:efflux RND transporter periplasmic adaptor subunit [Sandaracinus amylolyticus]UJR84172.1 Hypothetical protein I5071_62430 [Sandaracinus amylolyticus]
MRTEPWFVWIALFALGCSERAGAASAAVGRAPIEIQVVTAVADETPDVLRLNGEVAAWRTAELAPLVSGQVSEIVADTGTLVRQGDVVLRLRDTAARDATAAAEAMLRQARASVREGAGDTATVRSARARRDASHDGWERVRALAAAGSASERDLVQAEAGLRSAEAELEEALNSERAARAAARVAGAGLRERQRELADTELRAPFDGEVAARSVEVGEVVGPERSVVRIVETLPLRVRLAIPQPQVGLVREGAAVEIGSPSFSSQHWTGTVRRLAPVLDPEARTLEAEVWIEADVSGDARLRPGMWVSAAVRTGRTTSRVRVTETALRSRAGIHRVFVVQDGRVEERLVHLSDRRDGQAWVDIGLHDGEVVVVMPPATLRDGDSVVIAGEST